MGIKIISLSGRICSGKDTVCSMIQYQLSSFCDKSFENWSNDRIRGCAVIDSGWENKKFSYKLKLIASTLTGIPVEMFENRDFKNTMLSSIWKDNDGNVMTVRGFLQKLGTESIRNGLCLNTWVNALWSDVDNNSKWIITDTRFPDEAKSCKDRGGIVVGLTKNNHIKAIHDSETAMDDYCFDYVIDNSNDTLAETYCKVEDFLSVYKNGLNFD